MQTIIPQYRSYLFAASIIALSLTATNTLASGSYSPGGGGGNSYQLSKVIFYKKVTCSSCPYPKRGKNAKDAVALIEEIKQQGTAGPLSQAEQKSAISYLNRRFKL